MQFDPVLSSLIHENTIKLQLSKFGVILSWAAVGQLGQGHVNEKNWEDVITVKQFINRNALKKIQFLMLF